LPLAGPITKSELMALASVSPTVAGSKRKKLLDQTRDVLAVEARPAKDFESCETVSIAESAQCPSFDVGRNSSLACHADSSRRSRTKTETK
jgi:hypothetical protein